MRQEIPSSYSSPLQTNVLNAVYKWQSGFQVIVFSYECPLLQVHL